MFSRRLDPRWVCPVLPPPPRLTRERLCTLIVHREAARSLKTPPGLRISMECLDFRETKLADGTSKQELWCGVSSGSCPGTLLVSAPLAPSAQLHRSLISKQGSVSSPSICIARSLRASSHAATTWSQVAPCSAPSFLAVCRLL
jgi:hypothetical protein